jgi:hypothetical protein
MIAKLNEGIACVLASSSCIPIIDTQKAFKIIALTLCHKAWRTPNVCFQQAVYSCRYKQSAALIFDSASAWFSRDNVAMPGVSHFFKVGKLPHLLSTGVYWGFTIWTSLSPHH